MAAIFISYRREDSSGYAGRLHDALVLVFGRENVFMDIDTLAPGVDFVDEIRTTLERTAAVLVLIGRHWAGAHDDAGARRLDDARDYVRFEIATALQAGVRVIPVLVGGARMPDADSLPDDIRPLLRRNAVELSDRRWHDDTRALAETLRSVSAAATPDARVGNRPVNLGFDGEVVDGVPHGWFNSVGYVSHASARYTIRTVRRDGGACLMLSSPDAAAGEFGSVMQRFPAAFLAGRTVRLEGELRTDGVEGWAGLWIRADGEAVPNLIFDNMHRRGPRGTREWARYALDVNLPRETHWLNIGVVLTGAGTVWADDLRLLAWHRDGYWQDV
jgi:hypothetical protein